METSRDYQPYAANPQDGGITGSHLITDAVLSPEQQIAPKIEPGYVAATDLNKCIPSWKQIFPWMHYEENASMFTCLLCEWGSMDPNLIKIFQVVTQKDVHSVAKKLRKHKESPSHQKLSVKRQNLTDLCRYMYPLLKRFSQDTSNMEYIIETVTKLAGGIFPGPQELAEKYAFTGFMCKRMAECIEEDLLNSLSESPCFSILTLECNEYIIIRWLNARGESEEHLFCSHIGFPGQSLSCITYLENRSIDMSKLVSYTVLSKDPESESSQKIPPIVQAPVRCPDFDLFINWVEEASFLKELFEQLSVLTKLCKTYFHKFAGFPEASDLISIEEPFSHNCILNEQIIDFFFTNIKALRDIATDIHKKKRNMDAYGFCSLELNDHETMYRCAKLFPKLHAIMKLVFLNNSQYSFKSMEIFNENICKRMKELKEDSDEYILLSLFNVFVSHVLVTLTSPGKNVVDILSKNLDSVTASDVDKLLPNLLREFNHIDSNTLLDSFKSLQSSQPQQQKECFTMFQLSEVLLESPALQEKHPELCLFSKKVKVLPCFPAFREQSLFNVASLQIFLSKRVAKHLKHPFTLIILEGPPYDQMSVDRVLEMWARNWKAGPSHRINISRPEEIEYYI